MESSNSTRKTKRLLLLIIRIPYFILLMGLIGQGCSVKESVSTAENTSPIPTYPSAETGENIIADATPFSKATNTNENPEDSFLNETVEKDPFEPLNRVIFEVNRFIDGLILKPLATLYRDALPEGARKSIGNALDNAFAPVTFLNHTLQGNVEQATRSILRFGINSTVGILGFWDAASEIELTGRPTSFQETLHAWGGEPGPYLMLPIIGPSCIRGAIGTTVDWYSNPITYYFRVKDRKRSYVPYVIYATEVIDERSKLIETVEEIEQSSVDFYAAIRSLYFQRIQKRSE